MNEGRNPIFDTFKYLKNNRNIFSFIITLLTFIAPITLAVWQLPNIAFKYGLYDHYNINKNLIILNDFSLGYFLYSIFIYIIEAISIFLIYFLTPKGNKKYIENNNITKKINKILSYIERVGILLIINVLIYILSNGKLSILGLLINITINIVTEILIYFMCVITIKKIFKEINSIRDAVISLFSVFFSILICLSSINYIYGRLNLKQYYIANLNNKKYVVIDQNVEKSLLCLYDENGNTTDCSNIIIIDNDENVFFTKKY